MTNNKCPHFSVCSGCVKNLNSEPCALFYRAEEFFKQYGVTLTFCHGKPTEWRSRAKLAVSGTKEKLNIGLFKEHTHEVVDIPGCMVHHTQINKALQYIRRAIATTNIPLTIYNEHTHRGELRYLQCIGERSTQKVSLTLVINNTEHTNWKKFCNELVAVAGADFWHSLWINTNTQKTNTIFGQNWNLVFGKTCVWEDILGKKIPFGPSHFGQANLEMFEKLLQDIRQKIHPQNRVAEYYAGVGIISLQVSDLVASCLICEREKSAEEYFLLAKEQLPQSEQKKLQFITGDAAMNLESLQNADVCIVDPPRKGLDPKMIQALKEAKNIKQLIYVSCSFDSLQRDCVKILQDTTYRLSFTKSYLFFPGTNHLEFLTVFEKT